MKNSLFKKIIKHNWYRRHHRTMNDHDMVMLNLILSHILKYVEVEFKEDIPAELTSVIKELKKLTTKQTSTLVINGDVTSKETARNVRSLAFSLNKSSITNSPEIHEVLSEVMRLFGNIEPYAQSPLLLFSSDSGSPSTLSSYTPSLTGSTAESTEDNERSVNTNEKPSTSSQTVLQQQTIASVSPRVEVAPHNILVPSQQVVNQNQASTSGSSLLLLTAISSHHQASSCNTVTTTQIGGHKRPRDAEGDSSTGASEITPPQNKLSRLGEQTDENLE